MSELATAREHASALATAREHYTVDTGLRVQMSSQISAAAAELRTTLRAEIAGCLHAAKAFTGDVESALRGELARVRRELGANLETLGRRTSIVNSYLPTHMTTVAVDTGRNRGRTTRSPSPAQSHKPASNQSFLPLPSTPPRTSGGSCPRNRSPSLVQALVHQQIVHVSGMHSVPVRESSRSFEPECARYQPAICNQSDIATGRRTEPTSNVNVAVQGFMQKQQSPPPLMVHRASTAGLPAGSVASRTAPVLVCSPTQSRCSSPAEGFETGAFRSALATSRLTRSSVSSPQMTGRTASPSPGPTLLVPTASPRTSVSSPRPMFQFSVMPGAPGAAVNQLGFAAPLQLPSLRPL